MPRAMRVRARSIAPFRRCGPGTSTIQGQNAISVIATDGCKQPTAPATAPAMAAAQSGWMKGLPPMPDSHLRTSAPIAALVAISSRLVASTTPKMTPSDAAPTAANRVNRSVEAGGWRPANSNADCAAPAPKLAVADLIHHCRDGKHLTHVDAE